MLTFENVTAVFCKVKSGSADRLGALVAYVCTRCLLMAARLKRVVTRAFRTKIDVKQNVQTYIPLCVFPVCVSPCEIDANCVSARQLFFAARRNYVS